jgi:CheY-like chemotaxis protein
MTSPTRLLIVEDSELLRKMSSLAFPRRDYELHEAENGLKALAVLASVRQAFDAIILDLQMPDMNGVEFLRALRQRALHRDTPVIVATSEREGSPLWQEAREIGVAAIVKKPWKPHELAAVVQRAVAGNRPDGPP